MYVTSSELSLSVKYHIILIWKLSDNLSTIIKQTKHSICWTSTSKNDSDDEAYYLRGNVYRKMGDIRQALNNYLMAIELNPDSPAQTAYNAQIKILDFYNKDMYNH